MTRYQCLPAGRLRSPGASLARRGSGCSIYTSFLESGLAPSRRRSVGFRGRCGGAPTRAPLRVDQTAKGDDRHPPRMLRTQGGTRCPRKPG
jgi:hypothetical protein